MTQTIRVLAPTGSLKKVMDALVSLEETIDPDLPVWRWKPRGVPDLPCIYNWLAPSPFQVTDTHHWTDTLNILAHVGIRHTDETEEMAQLEEYADTFRAAIDAELWARLPLDGTAKRARRVTMQLVEDSFGSIPVLAVRFPLEIEMLRTISPKV